METSAEYTSFQAAHLIANAKINLPEHAYNKLTLILSLSLDGSINTTVGECMVLSVVSEYDVVLEQEFRMFFEYCKITGNIRDSRMLVEKLSE